jgi:hypothetical protein
LTVYTGTFGTCPTSPPGSKRPMVQIYKTM